MDAKHIVKVFKKKREDKHFVFVRANEYFIFAGLVTGEELLSLEAHIDFARLNQYDYTKKTRGCKGGRI